MADAMYTLYVAASRILSVINQLRGARAIEQHRPILFTRVGRFWEDDPVRYFLRDSPELLSPLEDDELRHVFVDNSGSLRYPPPGPFTHGGKCSVMIYTAGVYVMWLGICNSAFIHHSGNNAGGEVNWMVERNGVDGLSHPFSQDRADLRAVVGAIRYYAWAIPVYSNIIIATSSRYVAYGACRTLYSFSHDCFPLSEGFEQHEDLWAALVEGLNILTAKGTKIKFWLIPLGEHGPTTLCAWRALSLRGRARKYQDALPSARDL